MRINCGIIVKDDSELSMLKRAVWSVLPFVEGVYITANGKEVKGIEEYCKASPQIHYSYLPWKKDFAEQRNFNFSQMPPDSDYFFWIDSDDVLVGGENLQDVANLGLEGGKDVIFLTYWYGCRFSGDPSYQTLQDVEMEHLRERLIRPGSIKWVGRLHETPVPVEGAKHIYVKHPYNEKNLPIAILHTATLDKSMGNMERNKSILEIQLQEEREKGEADPRTLLYLMKIYAEEDDPKQWDRLTDMGREYLKKSGWDEERGTCNEQMAIVEGKRGNFEGAIKYLHEAIREWPHQPLFHIRLAQAYYNLKNFRAARYWLTVASQMDLEQNTANITNFKAMKVMFAELLVKLSFNIEKDVKKAKEAATLLFKEMPTKENHNQLLYIQDMADLNDACRDVHKLALYLDSIGEGERIPEFLGILPEAITDQPFATALRRKYTPPRKWKENEICYFANFAQPHFEKWDGTSLEKGIGGSETAVIELAKEWTKLGYKVTVYGDPFKKGEMDGVLYLPWHYFNKNDYFNIFIQWRGWQLAGHVKCNKFLVDLHDIYSPVDLTKDQLGNIDKIMVKSTYHRNLAPTVPQEKFLVVSNGVRI